MIDGILAHVDLTVGQVASKDPPCCAYCPAAWLGWRLLAAGRPHTGSLACPVKSQYGKKGQGEAPREKKNKNKNDSSVKFK